MADRDGGRLRGDIDNASDTTPNLPTDQSDLTTTDADDMDYDPEADAETETEEATEQSFLQRLLADHGDLADEDSEDGDGDEDADLSIVAPPSDLGNMN
jgi:hypothetical protein